MVDKGNPEREQIALYTQQSWKQLGADVKVDVEEWSVYIKRGNQIPSGDYDARTSWRITSADPDKTAEYTTGGVNNHYAYSNPEVDALMAKARSTIDEGTRVATFRKLQELIYRDAPLLWIYHQTRSGHDRSEGYPDLSIRDALPWATKSRCRDEAHGISPWRARAMSPCGEHHGACLTVHEMHGRAVEKGQLQAAPEDRARGVSLS